MTDSPLPLILALDISKTRTGCCFGRVGETPKFVSLHGKELTGVEAGAKLLLWLIDFSKVNKPALIVFEAPLERVGTGGSIKTIIILHCLAFLVEVFCAMKRIPFRKAHVNTVRKLFIGVGNLKTDQAEKTIWALCALLGWAPGNHDEADAGVVWHWGGVSIAPRHATIITPMLQAKVASQVEAGMLLRQGRSRHG